MIRLFLFLQILFLFSCNTPEKPASSAVSTESRSTNQTYAVIEIPAGTLDKYELNKETYKIEHEHKNGKPRVVQYLAYPGNYGYIPNTLLSKENGGDGDPLDVIILGAAVNRNDTIPIKVIGALKLLDRGEQDDKLIAVSADSPFSEVNSITHLDKKFPGAKSIIETWFSNYKGKGKMESQGFIENEKALSVLKMAQEDFNSAH